MNKLLNLEHIYIITATLMAASPQILVTSWFAVWWLNNSYPQDWRTPFFLVVIGYYSLVVVSVWVCCVIVCIRKGRPRLSAYMLPAMSVAAVLSLAGVSISFIAAGLTTLTLLILAFSLFLLGIEVACEALVRHRRAAREMNGAEVRRAQR